MTETMLTVPADLDMLDPGFRVESEPVRAAAAQHWYATTPLGPAVLHRLPTSGGTEVVSAGGTDNGAWSPIMTGASLYPRLDWLC